jgi:hypothetical protein
MWLIGQTGDPLSPAYYLMATALLSIIALMVMARRGRRRAKRQCSGGSSASEQYGVRPSAKSDHRHCRLLRSRGQCYGSKADIEARAMSALPPKADID